MGIVTTADDVVTGQGRDWSDEVPAEVLVHLQAVGFRPVNGSPRFLITAQPDATGVVDESRVGRAVSAAAHRFQHVTYEGIELDESMPRSDEHYTPNMVLGPVVTG